MPDKPRHIIESLRKKWILQSIISFAIISLGVGLVLGELSNLLFGSSYGWIFVFFLLNFILLLIFKNTWRATERDVTRYLDSHFPAMEESSSLLLLDAPTAGSLQELQYAKTIKVIQQELSNIKFPDKIKPACWFLLMAFFFFIVVDGISDLTLRHQTDVELKHIESIKSKRQKTILPSVLAWQVRVTPPSYTHLVSRVQDQPDIYAEEGSGLNWRIKTDQPVKRMKFLISDSEEVPLLPKNPDHTEWSYHSTLRTSGFYQLVIDSQISEHFRMEMIRDQFPEIEVVSPKPKTILEYGMSLVIPLSVSIRDDYGISSAGITTTISKGNGEAVKFTEKEIHFDESFREETPRYDLKKKIDLHSFGLIPGDELYFFIKAKDNKGQEQKSGVFIVSLADTADLMGAERDMSGLTIKPEYFRSERQIILETQQLLTDRSSISAEVFKNKSNDLGIDQKLLRLRYGKFLGEEGEFDELNPGSQNNVSNPSNFGNAASALDVYMDKHDNATDPGFFEKDTKDQLRATLTEMWNAELQLRTVKPAGALPYEYKALRLLKDLQQKSRLYVAKAGYQITPLDFGKRLMGEQDKILSPVQEFYAPSYTGEARDLQETLSVLQSVKLNTKQDKKLFEILKVAGAQIRGKAMLEPSRYISAYDAFQRIFNQFKKGTSVNDSDLQLVEQTLQEMIKPMDEIPSRIEQSGNETLSSFYFGNLKN